MASRDNGYFEIPIPIQQSFQHSAQRGEAFLTRYETLSVQPSAVNGVEGFSNVTRRVGF